jgi:hypothetical protein
MDSCPRLIPMLPKPRSFSLIFTSRTSHFLVVPFLVSLATVAAWFGLAGWSRTESSSEGVISDPMDEDRVRRVGPTVPALFKKDSFEAMVVQRMLRSPLSGLLNLPYCCHLLRLHGLGPMPGPHFLCGHDVLAALTDLDVSVKRFGEPVFFPTRSGIRFRALENASAMGAENHRDICLATFAEAGLPLSTEFTTPTEKFHLVDLLGDSVQNFHLRQDELPWTAVAYALYSSPGPRWTNRFGETFEWDELTEALLAAPFRRSSCCGTHLLYALTIIRRVEGMGRPLSLSVRARVDEWLKVAIASACARQAADGYWLADWWADAASHPADPNRRVDDSTSTRLLITGHLLECFTLAPPEFQPPADVYRRAARWVCRVLDDDRIASEESYCPRTHAVCAVRNLVESERNKAIGWATFAR